MSTLGFAPWEGNINDRSNLSNRWAKGYDDTLHAATGFPFAGYNRVPDEIVHLAIPDAGMRVLDLGTGTGNLAVRFAVFGCTVTGVNFSGEMLAAARRKVPNARFVRGNVTRSLDFLGDERFDLILSAYVFHEFDLSTKIFILGRLVRDYLTQRGRIVTGDIALPTVRGRRRTEDGPHSGMRRNTTGRLTEHLLHGRGRIACAICTALLLRRRVFHLACKFVSARNKMFRQEGSGNA